MRSFPYQIFTDNTADDSCNMSLLDAKMTIDNFNMKDDAISMIKLIREVYRVAYNRGCKSGRREMVDVGEKYINYMNDTK